MSMKLPEKFSIVFPIGIFVVSVTFLALLVIIPYIKNGHTRNASATIYYPNTPIVEASPTPEQIDQVSVLSSVAESLLQAPAPYIPIETMTPSTVTKQQTPSFYTELTTTGLLSNISDSSFTLIWLTEAPQPTLLSHGNSQNALTNKVTDDRGVISPSYLHSATAKNLKPENIYYFVGASPITKALQLPKTLVATQEKIAVSGNISGAPNNSECIVLAHVASTINGVSAPLSMVTNSSTWALPLHNARISTLDNYFHPTPTDNVTFDAFCIAPGRLFYAGSASSTIKQSTERSVIIPVMQLALN